MSRIGKMPITIPNGVTVQIEGQTVIVKGPKGELSRAVAPDMMLKLDGDQLTVERPSDNQQHRSLHGLTRSLLNNMVVGVSSGFSKRLEIHGVGYKAETTSSGVRLHVGYSHAIDYRSPAGIDISVENNGVKVEGIDKEMVGQVAAELRLVRPPEPYKGKGIRYLGEQVRRKAGKSGAKA
ncbi:MAG: 50S ribosomal protein L6 [Gemmatimonadales bacterium]